MSSEGQAPLAHRNEGGNETNSASGSNNQQNKSRSTSRPSPPPHPSVASSGTARDALLSSIFGLYLILAFFTMASMFRNARLPRPEKYKPTSKMPFDLDNALEHIKFLGKSLHFTGTQALEDNMQYIMTDIRSLMPAAKRNGYEIDLELFRSGPGNHFVDAGNIAKFVNSYDNITNVIARVRPNHIPHDSDARPLLINVHVDSALAAPGVSDILTGVGITMEVLRCIVAQPIALTELQRPIIFLFNGAEELVLTGAHSFVTQHPWGRVSAAFINLESIGSGNAFHLFRVGPNSPWLGRAFAKSVTYPTGAVSASDVFSSRLIPAETDWAMFTKAGGIPGYDFALLDNGYIYHTMRDDLQNMDTQGVLHGGIIVYELTLELAGKNDAIGEHLADTHRPSRLSSIGSQVANAANLLKKDNEKFAYFDILYLFTVYYDEGTAVLVHSLAIAFSVIVWLTKLSSMDWQNRMFCLRMLLVFPIIIAAGCASSTFAAYFYARVIGANLVWYGNKAKALLIFIPPTIYGLTTALFLLLPRNLVLDRFDHMLLPVSVAQIVMGVVLVRYSLMSAYIPAASLFVMTICVLQGDGTMPIVKHLEIMLVHAVFLEKLFHMCMSVILPLFGRVKSQRLPHDALAAIFISALSMPYMLGPSLALLTHYAKGLQKLRSMSLALCFWIAAFFVLVAPRMNYERSYTPYGTTAPKRLVAVHFHSPQMNPPNVLHVTSSDAVSPNLERLLKPLVSSDSNVGSLAEVPTFGSLKAGPMESFHKESKFMQFHEVFRSGKAPVLAVPNVTVTSAVRGEGGWNVSLEVEGPDSHIMTMRFAQPPENPAVLGWSAETPPQKQGYFAILRHFGTSRFEVSLLVRDDGEGKERPRVPVVFSAMRLGVKRSPNDLAMLKWERWEAALTAVSTAIEVEV